jgi:hypothetical protein
MVRRATFLSAFLAGWWVAGLAMTPAAVLETPVEDGVGRIEGVLGGDLAASAVVELHEARPLTAEERKVVKAAGVSSLPAAKDPVRLPRALSLRIGGEAMPLPARDVAGLVDINGIRVWRREATVYCQVLGRSGFQDYQVTFAFALVRGRQWVLSSRSFTLTGSARVETREHAGTIAVGGSNKSVEPGSDPGSK